MATMTMRTIRDKLPMIQMNQARPVPWDMAKTSTSWAAAYSTKAPATRTTTWTCCMTVTKNLTSRCRKVVW